ncbi:hypothetical protein GCM10009547_12410 [Sporichthya brevicatena]|uniref:Cytochrome P450 n=1 Tax=Sporichthya brevicatena TaxID=171442 RepID=A0ABP3RPN0_9ACTN
MTDSAIPCPFARVDKLEDIGKLMRSRTAVTHNPDFFAARAADEVNGEINVREFLGAAMIYDDGESHRLRRKLLNPLVRADALHGIREDVVLPEADRLLAQRLAKTDADGVYRLDLMEFLERVFIHFTAKLIGLIGVDSDDRIALMASLAGPLAAGTSSAYLQDRAEVNRRALKAKARYVEEFFRPSLAWHREQVAKIEAGELSPDDGPDSLLRLVAAEAAPEWKDEDNAIVESTMLFAASVGTSTQSIAHTLDLVSTWLEANPQDRGRRTDPTFLLNALEEVVRLRAPFSPYTTRMAMEPYTLSSGVELQPGQELHIEWVKANRDRATFGEDADRFNPNRATPADGTPRYGVGFGLGTHQCYGLRVVVGNDGKGGAHVELLRKLMVAGVRPDPDNPPVELAKDMSKFEVEDIPRYLTYPVVFDRAEDSLHDRELVDPGQDE